MQSEQATSLPIKKRKDKLPKAPFENIAISLSGGGFRATAFHLGTLTYLSTKTWNEVDLLERVRILSTVSAGTFTGAKYVSVKKQGGTIYDCYKSIYHFMNSCDLVAESLKYLSDDANWKKTRQRTLINAFASIYFREFEQEKFGLLWNEKIPFHIKEIYFNATEFNFALPFRFQKSEELAPEHADKKHRFIGNRKIKIPVEVAKEIRIADIIAASSCFPFGFEPINFPDDFIHEGCEKLKDNSVLPHSVYDGDKIEYPIGLMDGSIDDNQGVDAVVIAEERMRHYPDNLKSFFSDDDKAVDLYIISDVSPPNMESFIRSTTDKIPVVGKWNFDSLRSYGIASAIVGFTSMSLAFFIDSKTGIMALSVFGTLQMLIALILLIFSKGITGLTRKFGVPDFVVRRLFHFDRMPFGTLYNMFINRRRSGMKLVTDVFIKQMRWFSFERVYGDRAWRTRIVLNAAFKLLSSEVEKRNKKYPQMNSDLLNPESKIISVTEKAMSMPTKLWFTTDELDKKIPDAIIACGQFTTCFTLLEYIEKVIKNPRYQSDYEKYNAKTKKAILQLHDSLMKDWLRFKQNPYWMVEEWNEGLKVKNRN